MPVGLVVGAPSWRVEGSSPIQEDVLAYLFRKNSAGIHIFSPDNLSYMVWQNVESGKLLLQQTVENNYICSTHHFQFVPAMARHDSSDRTLGRLATPDCRVANCRCRSRVVSRNAHLLPEILSGKRRSYTQCLNHSQGCNSFYSNASNAVHDENHLWLIPPALLITIVSLHWNLNLFNISTIISIIENR